MGHKKKHIDDFFREKLGSYSETPPADAWQDMDKKLDTLVPHVPTSPLRWLGHVGMVSLIAVLGVSLVQKFTGKSKNGDSIVKEQTINNIDASTATVAVDNSVAEATTTSLPEFDNGNEESANNATTPTVTTPSSVSDDDYYTEDAGKEYIPGVTRIRDEHIVNEQEAVNNVNQGSGMASGYNSSATLNNIEQTIENERVNVIDNQVVNSSSNNSVQAAKNYTNPSVAKIIQPSNLVIKESRNAIKPGFNRWEAGVKGGYERGFTNADAQKYVIAPYVAFKVSKKVALMIQSGVKYVNSPVRAIGGAQSFYQQNADGKVTDNGTYTSTKVEGSSLQTYYNTNYRYTQSHDSIVKYNRVGGSYMEYELPVLLRYEIGKKVSVYGGVNMIYSQVKGISEHTYTKSGIVKTIDTVITAKTMPTAPAVGDIITYTGTPFSDYNGPLYPATRENQIRLGAMLGFSYKYSDRWLLDALLQKNPAPQDVRGGYNINTPLSSTYFRLSVGYKLTKE
ncbi:MAG: hypothetical protein K9G49_08460 [Taibaiella sp.]|nr:hypothetical protein [Taibaiella sp.]